MNQPVTFAALLITLTSAAPALAEHGFPRYESAWRQREAVRLDHRGDSIEKHFDRLGDRIDARLDRKANLIEKQFDLRADRAAALGKFRQAEWLHAKGERIARHYDRKGDRVDARLDRRGERIDRRFDHRAARLEQGLRDHGRHHARNGEHPALHPGGPGMSWSRHR